ncbi:unnamed protein product [Spirodela intermedia]|uniref:non-specific serine/threonine protein kinase n=2 Tax=Spirodela intermedia TaxID=51605 RepID=A0A7I8K9B3_SPIIN|nr:unnamed protein product [Spirodela intermedia]
MTVSRALHALAVVCLVGLGGLAGGSRAQATTEPSEVQALNSILGRWGLKASSLWNISGNPCTGIAIDTTDHNTPSFNPAVKCDCSFNNQTTCHITHLKVYAKDVTGSIPEEFRNLTYLRNLNLAQNYLSGPFPAFFGNLTLMEYLTVGINSLSGSVPKELGNLRNLKMLSCGSNRFTGPLPPELGNLTEMEQLYIASAGVSGQIPSSFSNLRKLKIVWASDNNFTGKIPDFIGNWTDLNTLRFQGNSFQGPVPSSFSNLTKMNDLRIGDLVEGSLSLDFIRNMKNLSILILRNSKISATIPSNIQEYTRLGILDLSFNNLTGPIPQSLFSLPSLAYLFLGNNSLSGSLPSVKSSTLKNIDLSYNYLSGGIPGWIDEENLQLNLVANNFVIDSSNTSVPAGLNCLQRGWPCNRGSPLYYSFGINCGGVRSIAASDGILYEADGATLTTASSFVTDSQKWGVSTVGLFVNSPNVSYVENSLSQFTNTFDSELFQSTRLSPSSLRYYGLGLENGNYTVKLQFAETAYPDSPVWQSNGRRVFDIYIQGVRVEKDFNIKQEAGGVSLDAVAKQYTAAVTSNFLEVHLFWSGRGTCCIPRQGYYGPAISAISLSPFDFEPTVSNRPLGSTSRKNKYKILIGGTVGGAAVVFFLLLFGCLKWVQIRRRKSTLQDDADFQDISDRPHTFSYAELRDATGDFNAENKLGEGGFGPVYKGKLPDGRTVAVKQLSVTSHQGKRQFLAEISIISAVQHRNLVKLLGCCFEKEKRLLVYEYLENNSLDRALFGSSGGGLQLDWAVRYEICVGMARGLAYLHEESRLRIVHRDVKPSNVLLDGDLNPKISDFGLAKLYDEKMTHITTRIAGTIGYLAPEYAMTGHLTEKVDVFAFGVVVLEILSGRPNAALDEHGNRVYLLEWVWNLRESKSESVLDMMDPSLSWYNEEEAARLVAVALLCTQAPPVLRPAMSRVGAMLAGDAEVDEVAAKPGYLRALEFGDLSSSYTATTTSTPPAGGGGGVTSISTSTTGPPSPLPISPSGGHTLI